MNDERQNAFERSRARATLREDRKTRFARNDENRIARLRNTDAQQDRIKRNELQRSSWAGPNRAGDVKTASGVALDSQTAKLKSASDADRKPKSSPASEPSDATVYAVATQWMADHPGFHRSPHNGANFNNFMLTQIATRKLTWDYESFTAAHDWLEANGYFEKAPARKRREFAMTSAPKVYPPFLSDAERAVEDDRAQVEQARRIGKDVERALSLPFDQLRKEVRGGLKAYGSQEVR
jgi:hypothetical protein